VLLQDYSGNWTEYLEALYGFFQQDFAGRVLQFGGVRLVLKRHPIIDGKEATFWHLISEGAREADRLPDLRRCERIRWPRPIIENFHDSCIKVWENERKGEARVCLWLEENEYLVVLALRRGYVILWTAYPVVEDHRKAKLRKEYGAARKS
jgi:hypothetical protein